MWELHSNHAEWRRIYRHCSELDLCLSLTSPISFLKACHLRRCQRRRDLMRLSNEHSDGSRNVRNVVKRRWGRGVLGALPIFYACAHLAAVGVQRNWWYRPPVCQIEAFQTVRHVWKCKYWPKGVSVLCGAVLWWGWGKQRNAWHFDHMRSQSEHSLGVVSSEASLSFLLPWRHHCQSQLLSSLKRHTLCLIIHKVWIAHRLYK